jgi:hypothetical protein
MGMHEDDRIRSKNRAQNEAFDLIEGLKYMGYSSSDILKYAKLALELTSDQSRINVFNTMISIVRSTNEDINNS